MLSRQSFYRTLVHPFIALLLVAGFGSAARADIVSLDTLLAERQHSDLRDQLHQALAQQDVLHKLQTHGVSAEQAALRIAALSPDELTRLAQQFDDLPAGGDVTLLLVIIILVLLLR